MTGMIISDVNGLIFFVMTSAMKQMIIKRPSKASIVVFIILTPMRVLSVFNPYSVVKAVRAHVNKTDLKRKSAFLTQT